MRDQLVGTITVATISVRAGGAVASGEVTSDGSVYWATVNGSSQGHAGNLEAAIERLVTLLAMFVRKEGPGWGASVHCHRAGWGVAFGNVAGGGGGGGGLPPCVSKAIGSGPFNKVEHALNAAARALKRCCG